MANVAVKLTGNIKKGYLKQVTAIGFPIMVQGIVFQTQALINRAFLGNLKTEYLSIIGNTMFPFYTVLQIIIAISTGTTIYIARNTGAKRPELVKEYSEASLKYNTLLCTALFLFWFFFSGAVFSAMGVDRAFMGYCNRYVQITAVYLVFFGMDISIQSILQGTGNTRPIMYSGIGKVVLNIFLDWALIFGNLGLPALGLMGSALATAIANIFSAVVMVSYLLLAKKLPFRISFSGIFRGAWARYKDIAGIGLPTAFETLAWYAGNLVVIRILNSLSSIAAGIYTLIYEIDVLIYLIQLGISRAALTLVGHKTGEGNIKEAKNILTSCIQYGLILAVLSCTPFVLFPGKILGIFSGDRTLIGLSTVPFILNAVSFFPKSLNVVSGGGIRGLGDTRWMLFTQVLGTGLVISSACAAVFILKLDITGVYIAFVLDECIRAVLNLAHFFGRRKTDS